MTAELSSATVTFLFTDIEGSTGLLKQLRERYGQVLADHQALLHDAVAAQGGEVVDTQGDSYFCVFRRARQAVAAAAEAQRALAGHGWPEGVELRVRMGIHTGEAELQGGRYHGVAVHRAARIGAAGHGGQVLCSQTTHDVLQDEEAALPGVSLRDLGVQRLKDLDRPVRLYQLVIEGLPAKFPPLRTLGEVKERGRRRAVLIGALTGVIAAAVAIPIFALGGGSGTSVALAGVAGNAVGAVDPATGRITASIPVNASPTAIAFGVGSVWVTSVNDNTVKRVDPKTRAVVQTIPVGNGPTGIAVGGGYVWVANSYDGTVSQIDPRVNGGVVVQTIRPVGINPSGVAYGLGGVWVANSVGRTVVRIDPQTGVVGTAIPVDAGADAIAAGAGAVWVASEATGSVARIDPRTKTVMPITVGADPAAITVGGGYVWVANSQDNSVSRIDPSTNGVKTIEVGSGPSGVAVASDGKTVWVSNALGGTLSRIDPAQTKVVQTVQTGHLPEALVMGASTVYLAVQGVSLAHRGGTLIAAQHDGTILPEAANIDPAHGYTLWELLTLTNDGLVGYKRVGGSEGYRVVPDLATALPTPTNGGRTYAFQLHRDIHYSTGALVRPADFRRAIERALATGGGNPPDSYLAGIVGAEACIKTPKRCHLARGIVVDSASNAVIFHLTNPDPDFLYKLALPMADAVPASTPLKARLPLPATGPYEIASYDVKHSEIRLVRNPRFRLWSAAAQPAGFPDAIVERFAYSDGGALRAVERGRADLVTFSVGPRAGHRLAVLRTRYASQLHEAPALGTTTFVLHTRVPPFNDVRVRRAVAYAIDRNRLLALANGLGQPTCQTLPPNFFGYHRYCPYTLDGSPTGAPDLAKARQLVTESGTKGMTVTVWTVKGFWEGPATYLVSVLKRLGYNAKLKIVDGNTFIANVPDSRRNVQADGPFPWATDYPTPYGFLSPILTCASFKPRSNANNNWAQFCDPKIDAQIARAVSLQNSDPQAAAALWGAVDRALVNEAPWVPFLNEQSLTLVSQRVHNYISNPLTVAPFFDQLWVR